MNRLCMASATQWAAWAGLAYVLKRHYASAGPEDLAWILGPTADLVGLATGETFAFEPGVGYVSRALATAIVPGCAGVNFLIAASATVLLAAGLSGLRAGPNAPAGLQTRRPGSSGSGVVRASGGALLRTMALLVLAYMTTVVVNGLRIALDIAVRSWSGWAQVGWSHAQSHRALGVVIYLVALLVLYAGVQGRAGRGLPLWLVPAGAYLVVALGIPFLNGAAANANYAHHAWAVLGLVLAVIGPLAAIEFLIVRCRGSRLPPRAAGIGDGGDGDVRGAQPGSLPRPAGAAPSVAV